MKAVKPATTFEEQLERLRKKQIVITDERACLDFLKQVNYYRLSGYYLPYMDRVKNICFKPTDFHRIAGVYYFDAKLRSLLLATIETIEIYLRSQIANYHSMKYGPEGYCDPSSFNSDYDHVDFLKRVEQCKKENDKSHVIKHHKKIYGGHFPLWAIIEYFSMGMLSYFYAGMKNQDKAYLASSLFGVNYQAVESWLHCLTDLRNCCAHYSRLYYRKFTALPKMPIGYSYIPTRRLFAQLYVLRFLYPSSRDWNIEFMDPLRKIIEEYKDSIILKHLDFPEDWDALLTK